jgi:tetratricopeptide (TPR) repeat protein
MGEITEVSTLFKKGLLELDQAEFEVARECFEGVVIEEASNSEAWFQLGVCYLETGRPDLAIEALSRTLWLNPKNADALYLLGNAYGSTGLLEEALEMYQNALNAQPHHPKAEEFLVRTQSLIQSREHFRKAARLFDEGKFKDPATDDFKWLDQAFRELIHSVASFPQSPAGREFESCIKLILDRHLEKRIEVPVSEENRFWAEHCERGKAFLTSKLWQGAYQAYSEAAQFEAGHAFVHHALGIAQYQMGDMEGAMKSWLGAIEIDPEFNFARLGSMQVPKQYQAKAH